jgi:hypothetical protein
MVGAEAPTEQTVGEWPVDEDADVVRRRVRQDLAVRA